MKFHFVSKKEAAGIFPDMETGIKFGFTMEKVKIQNTDTDAFFKNAVAVARFNLACEHFGKVVLLLLYMSYEQNTIYQTREFVFFRCNIICRNGQLHIDLQFQTIVESIFGLKVVFYKIYTNAFLHCTDYPKDSKKRINCRNLLVFIINCNKRIKRKINIAK